MPTRMASSMSSSVRLYAKRLKSAARPIVSRKARGLTRRPSKGAPAKDVEVQMLHSLASVLANVSDHAVTA